MATQVDARPAGAPALGGAAIVLRVLVPFGIGFFVSYVFRTVNAVIAPLLSAEIGLTPSNLGLLTAIYFIAFAAVQVPLGVMLDRYGPRRVQLVLLWFAVLGAVLFAFGHSFAVLLLGRALIGLGVAGGLMAALKANAIWWPAQRLPMINNFSMVFGTLGAMTATAPVQFALTMFDWREVFLGIGLIAVGVIVLLAVVVPENEAGTNRQERVRDQFAAIATIFTSGEFWRVGGLFMTCGATTMSYLTLWAGPWLADVAGLGRQAAATHLLLAQFGMMVGILGSGTLATYIRRYGISPYSVVAVCVGTFLGIQVLLALGVTSLAIVLWPAFAIFGSTAFLCYAVLMEHFGSAMTGRVLTAANMLVFIGAFVIQWAIGVVIGLHPLSADGGVTPEAHRDAFFMVMAIEAVAYLWFIKPRRKARA